MSAAVLLAALCDVIDGPSRAAPFLQARLAGLGYEVFAVLFLDAQHRLIRWEELFRGTLTQTSVYPREVVRRALTCNCAAVILAHNHPSLCGQPSRADQILTRELQSALKLIDVQVLDHIILADGNTTSFAQLGLL